MKRFRPLCLASVLVALIGAADLALADSSPIDANLTLGFGTGVTAAYAGSKENKPIALPVFDYQHSSGLFVSTMRGVGWDGGTETFQYSFALNSRAARDDRDHKVLGLTSGSKELAGMGKVKASLVGQIGLVFRVSDLINLRASLETPISQRENGSVAVVGWDYALWREESNSVSVGTAFSVADSEFMQTYFGVTQAQSRASGFSKFQPKAGLYKTALSLAWTHSIDKKWSMVTTAGIDHLMGDAAKSPLVLRKTSPQAGVIISYTY